jgi:hypothetical protein
VRNRLKGENAKKLVIYIKTTTYLPIAMLIPRNRIFIVFERAREMARAKGQQVV